MPRMLAQRFYLPAETIFGCTSYLDKSLRRVSVPPAFEARPPHNATYVVPKYITPCSDKVTGANATARLSAIVLCDLTQITDLTFQGTERRAQSLRCPDNRMDPRKWLISSRQQMARHALAHARNLKACALKRAQHGGPYPRGSTTLKNSRCCWSLGSSSTQPRPARSAKIALPTNFSRRRGRSRRWRPTFSTCLMRQTGRLP